MRAKFAVSEAALGVLSASTVEGKTLRLPPGQLARGLYVEVNKVLEALGGKWDRASKTHRFPSSPEGLLERVLETRQATDEVQLYQFYATPAALADRMVRALDVKPGQTILEPSAGEGALLEALMRLAVTPLAVDALDLDPKRVKSLVEKGFGALQVDFLEFPLRALYDRVLMNPPFTNQQDILHVTKAYWLLKPGGKLVAIMSPGFIFREDRRAKGFRALLEAVGGTYERLPEETFKGAGTAISTVLVMLTRESA